MSYGSRRDGWHTLIFRFLQFVHPDFDLRWYFRALTAAYMRGFVVSSHNDVVDRMVILQKRSE